MKETKVKAVVNTGVRVGKVNGYKNSVLHAKRDKKRQKAEQMMWEHNQLTISQKIAKAKSRRGESKKEIARLTKLLNEVAKPFKPAVIAKPVEIIPASQEAPKVTEKKKRVSKPKTSKIS